MGGGCAGPSAPKGGCYAWAQRGGSCSSGRPRPRRKTRPLSACRLWPARSPPGGRESFLKAGCRRVLGRGGADGRKVAVAHAPQDSPQRLLGHRTRRNPRPGSGRGRAAAGAPPVGGRHRTLLDQRAQRHPAARRSGADGPWAPLPDQPVWDVRVEQRHDASPEPSEARPAQRGRLRPRRSPTQPTGAASGPDRPRTLGLGKAGLRHQSPAAAAPKRPDILPWSPNSKIESPSDAEATRMSDQQGWYHHSDPEDRTSHRYGLKRRLGTHVHSLYFAS